MVGLIQQNPQRFCHLTLRYANGALICRDMHLEMPDPVLGHKLDVWLGVFLRNQGSGDAISTVQNSSINKAN